MEPERCPGAGRRAKPGKAAEPHGSKGDPGGGGMANMDGAGTRRGRATATTKGATAHPSWLIFRQKKRAEKALFHYLDTIVT